MNEAELSQVMAMIDRLESKLLPFVQGLHARVAALKSAHDATLMDLHEAVAKLEQAEASMHTDTKRLDWLESNRLTCGITPIRRGVGWMIQTFNDHGVHHADTLRDAIDAAMNKEAE